MTNGPERPSTEVTPDTWTPGRRSTLAAPDTTEHGMSLDQPSAPPAAKRGRRERVFITVCAAFTVAAIAGVALLLTRHEETTATSPPPSTQISTGPASPSPAPLTPEDLAAEEAKARYLEYIRVSDRVAQGGYDDPRLYEMVAIDPLATQLQLAARRKPAGQRTTGEVQIASLTVQSVELSSTPETYSAVWLLACLDVSGTAVVDGSGKSTVPADRLPRVKSAALLQRIPATAFDAGDRRPTDWYVAELDQRGEAC